MTQRRRISIESLAQGAALSEVLPPNFDKNSPAYKMNLKQTSAPKQYPVPPPPPFIPEVSKATPIPKPTLGGKPIEDAVIPTFEIKEEIKE
ncbi:MAG: hypothetical protein KGL95_05390, partial [Patescibacteria group bacterium]|nr:hypothetical protein [Patescibacteria group bacterium]